MINPQKFSRGLKICQRSRTDRMYRDTRDVLGVVSQDYGGWEVPNRRPRRAGSMCVCLVVQSCLTLCDPMDCSLPGSSVHRIPQARILEWIAMPSSRESSQSRDRTQVSRIAGGFFTSRATVQSKSECRKSWCSSSKTGRQRKHEFSLIDHFLFHSGLQKIGWSPPAEERAIWFSHPTNSSINLIQKYPHRNI